MPATLLNKRLQQRCFPEYCEIITNNFLKEHFQWLELILTLLFPLKLLKIVIHFFLHISASILGWVNKSEHVIPLVRCLQCNVAVVISVWNKVY